MNKSFKIIFMEQTILNTFKYYKQGSSVPSDGNCGLHAISKALVNGVFMMNKIKPNSLMVRIFLMFDLKDLPNYWWSDEELAVIANYFGYDLYIFNETDKTGIVFGKGIRPPLVLYSVNNNSHWIPGKKTLVPSSCVPKCFTVIKNISEVLSIKQIKIKIKRHLVMQSLILNSGYFVESYSRRNNRSPNISSERRVASSISRYNGSCSGGRVGSRPKLKESRGGKEKGSNYAKENYNGKEEGNHSKIEEKSVCGKSYESLLVLRTPPVNGTHSRGTTGQKISMYVILKNAMLSKMIKYKKLFSFNSKAHGDDFEDAELNAVYNSRFAIMRDFLHNFFSKNKRKLLKSKGTEASVASQSLELFTPLFEANKYPKVDFYWFKNDDSTLSTPIDCSSNEVIDYYTDLAVDYPFTTSDCPFKSADCPCDTIDCPFTVPAYAYSDEWVNDDYVTDSLDGYALKRDKNMGVRLFNRVYNQTVKMNKKIIASCFVKQKSTAKALSTIGLVLMAPAMASSVIASPIIADWMAGASELGSPVMQMASEVAAPTMAALDVATSTMVTPQDNDPVVKPKTNIKRSFSIKKIWHKKM